MLRNIFVSIIVFATALFANSLSLVDNGDGTWGVGYESSEAIGGFQFNVDGAGVSNTSGGDAAANGFMVSASGSTVIAFSLTGSTIPAGDGILINLSLDSSPSGLSSLVFSDASGSPIDFTFDGGSDDGGDDGGSGGEVGDQANSLWLVIMAVFMVLAIIVTMTLEDSNLLLMVQQLIAQVVVMLLQVDLWYLLLDLL